jgi:hypothetical protein
VKQGDGFNTYRREDDRRQVANGKPAPALAIDWPAEALRLARSLTSGHREQLATALGLPAACLDAIPLLGFFHDPHGGPSWTFPEHDAAGNVTAINRRYVADGSKKVMQGGRRGVYLPEGWRERPGPVLIPEGVSDVLALTAIGLPAIGRPNDKGGAEILAALLRDAGREVVVVGENDKKENGHWPGREGAEFVAKKLATLLGRPVKWSMPPDGVKDSRLWVCRAASATDGPADWIGIGRTVADQLIGSACAVGPEPSLVAADVPAELIVTPLFGKKVKPVKYLIPGRVPAGKLILCGARGGSGKSTLWRSIAAALSVGRCALGLNYPNPAHAKVMIFAAEDGPEDTILPGLLAEGADVSRIAIVEGVRRRNAKENFTLAPEDVSLLKERLTKSPDVKLIILDPIASFVGRSKIDDHRAAELRLVLDPLSELAESTGVTIAMIAHLNKSSGDAVDRIAGSAAYRDAVRAAYLVCEDPEDESRRLLMPVKENLPGFERTTIPFALEPLPDSEADEVMKREQLRHLTGEDREAAREQLRRLRFDAAVSVDPNEAMKAKKVDGTKVQRCKEWL